jgi:glutamate-1-semialdehyde 2,1-aminomutase
MEMLILAPVLLIAAVLLWKRLQLSRAKHGSLAGHPRWARRLARLLPTLEYSADAFFRTDEAPETTAVRRRQGFERLTALYAHRFARTAAATKQLAGAVADMEFTSRYRVPFQFSRHVREHLSGGSMLASSSGRTVTDLDGNVFFDLTGSYGVNLFGNDFYKGCIERGSSLVSALGPVLGAMHPVVQYNVERLREISGLDAVSFHMSGTEAVMQAVRLARYHTGRNKLVRFCGAYHGWWGAVQPGIGNPQTERDTLTLADLSDKALHVLETRSDIACLLVNPVQALHPNANAPGDAALVGGTRSAGFDRDTYSRWLQRLREVCTRRGIVMILDEVMVGFRLARGGAQEYFDVNADMVTYGKSLGGGLPVGVLCGRADLMQRFNEDRPADFCFARGTFNAHPHVMGAMHEFLCHLESPAVAHIYRNIDALWNHRAAQLNARLEAAQLPLRVAALGTIWTISYTRVSRYHWMLQYYLRAEGLALSWVGSGRLIFSLDYTEAEFEAVSDRIVAAARAMEADGWWWTSPTLTQASIRRQLRREIFQAWWRACMGSISSPLSRYRGARRYSITS